MKEIVLQIPTLDKEQNIEIDVKINGRNETIKYHVEIIDWDNIDTNKEDKTTVIKRVIKEKSNDWELIQIGEPSKNNLPIMFRKKK